MTNDHAVTEETLDATTLLGLGEFEVGDELWVPVSMIQEDGAFRAMRIEITDRRSVGDYEGNHAINPWSEDETARETITIDGEEWCAVKHDDRYRLFKADWGPDEPTRLPSEEGVCSFCLDPDSYLDDEHKGRIHCDACGETEIIVHARAESVSEVRDTSVGS